MPHAIFVSVGWQLKGKIWLKVDEQEKPTQAVVQQHSISGLDKMVCMKLQPQLITSVPTYRILEHPFAKLLFYPQLLKSPTRSVVSLQSYDFILGDFKHKLRYMQCLGCEWVTILQHITSAFLTIKCTT